jgi:hypothetical protein
LEAGTWPRLASLCNACGAARTAAARTSACGAARPAIVSTADTAVRRAPSSSIRARRTYTPVTCELRVGARIAHIGVRRDTIGVYANLNIAIALIYYRGGRTVGEIVLARRRHVGEITRAERGVRTCADAVVAHVGLIGSCLVDRMRFCGERHSEQGGKQTADSRGSHRFHLPWCSVAPVATPPWYRPWGTIPTLCGRLQDAQERNDAFCGETDRPVARKRSIGGPPAHGVGVGLRHDDSRSSPHVDM